MKTEEEISLAAQNIHENNTLTYSYREDVIAVLNWVLGGDKFDGLFENETKKEHE